MTRGSYRGLIALALAVIAMAGCTGRGPTTTAVPKPIPTLQPGEYATVPPTCELISQAAVHPYIPHVFPPDADGRHSRANCAWFDADGLRPGGRALFQQVVIVVNRYDPIQVSGGATATQVAISGVKSHIDSDWHTVPGLGDQAYEKHEKDGTRDPVGSFSFWVQRKNVLIQFNCQAADQRKDTARGQRVCLDLARQAVTNLDARN